ncbi:hypothetical protein E0W72_11390 [Flavobacterium arcticum]|nr:hypothetical protein [Flavobacterium arcticum]KAF2508244.1 hypothetical protein E0W72_11390 [Flavobacterium arcticum]
MHFLKKTAIIVASITVLLLLINFGISYWVTQKLPKILQSEKDFPYNINYDDIDVRLISGSFTIHNAYLAPKDSLSTKNKGTFGKIKQIEVEQFNLWALLWQNHIKVKSITIDSPEVILYHKQKKHATQDSFIKPLKNTITTQRITIKKGKLRILDSLQNVTVTASNINFKITNTTIDSASVTKEIPVRYKNYSFSCDSLLYKVNKFYTITLAHIENNEGVFSASDFKLIPQQNRTQFNNSIPVERDQFTITAAKIDIPENDWGYNSDTLFVHIPRLNIEEVDANIYRGKMVKDDLKTKKLYSQMLRELDFDLKVDTLTLKKSTIVYEEQLSYDKPSGKVSFSNFDASIYNLYSPVGKKEIPDTTIDVQALFMKQAPLQVHWFFNITDASDAFTIQGKLQKLDATKLNAVTKGLMNAKTSGNINKVDFTFNGNREKSTGTFAIHYDNLKVEILKKDSNDKNELLSIFGNLIIKNNSNNTMKNTDVAVERVKNKSVFNFLWLFIQQGLKNTALPSLFTTNND